MSKSYRATAGSKCKGTECFVKILRIAAHIHKHEHLDDTDSTNHEQGAQHISGMADVLFLANAAAARTIKT